MKRVRSILTLFINALLLLLVNGVVATFFQSSTWAEDSQVWHRVDDHLKEVQKYLPGILENIRSNPASVGKSKPDNFIGAVDGGAGAQALIGTSLVGLLGNPGGECPRARYVRCYCVDVQPPPICVTRYYQAIQYRYPQTLAEGGALFQSDLIPKPLMEAYRQDLARRFNTEFLREVLISNLTWTLEGAVNQGAPMFKPPPIDSTIGSFTEIAKSFTSIPDDLKLFAAWTSGQTTMIGYHAVPAIVAREYAAMLAGARDDWNGNMHAPIPKPRRECPGAPYNPGALWTYPILQPPAEAYKVHQLKTSRMMDVFQWFASEAHSDLSYIPQTSGKMLPYGAIPPHISYPSGFTYEVDKVHRQMWMLPQPRVHQLSLMNRLYFENQARCFQKELGVGGYLANANFIPRVFPAHRTGSFLPYEDSGEPCLPYNLGPRIQFATGAQGPVFNAQHLGSLAPFMALSAAGYYSGLLSDGAPVFTEENLGLPVPFGDQDLPWTMKDPVRYHKGNNLDGTLGLRSCGSYAVPPLTGDYGVQPGFDKGLVTNDPNGVWIVSMWDWVKGFKRELTMSDCDYFLDLGGGGCGNMHYAY